MSGTEKDIWCDDGRPMCRHGGRSHSLNVLCPDDEPTPDRHPKWKRVEPGTVIPAGQPFRIEYSDGTAGEYLPKSESWILRLNEWYFAKEAFVDSSWKPPLVLPTEPTWGIAVHSRLGTKLGRFRLDGAEFWHLHEGADNWSWRAHNVLDFIPLTDEQVARIEAAR